MHADRIDLKTAERTLANAELAFLGTKRRVGHLRSHTSSREGKLDVVGSQSAASIDTAVVEGETCVCNAGDEDRLAVQFGQINSSCISSQKIGTAPRKTPRACRNI